MKEINYKKQFSSDVNIFWESEKCRTDTYYSFSDSNDIAVVVSTQSQLVNIVKNAERAAEQVG